MPKYTPSSNTSNTGARLTPRQHRSPNGAQGKHAKKGCLMALPQVVVVVARLIFTRRSK